MSQHRTLEVDGSAVTIRPYQGDSELRICARMMADSELWIALKRDYDASLTTLSVPTKELYVALIEEKIVGFALINMQGAFIGYIQSLCVAPGWRGKRLGSNLARFVEERILRETPNVFITVSSFNLGARRLYERLGYQVVGELTDYVVPGHSEILLRKSVAPLSEFRSTGSH